MIYRKILVFMIFLSFLATGICAAQNTGKADEAADTVPTQVLVELLGSENERARKYAVENLLVVCDASLATFLDSALKTPVVEVEEFVLANLSRISKSYVISLLTRMLSDGDSEIRRIGVEKLGDFSDTLAIIPLMNVVKEEKDYTVRREAAFSLGNIGKPAVPFLVKALKGSTRAIAAFALGRIGDTSAIPFLIESLNDPSKYIRERVAKDLGKFGKPAVDALVKILSDKKKSKNARKVAVEALGYIGDTSAIPVLMETLNDRNEEIRNTAVEAMHWLGKSASDLVGKKLVEDESRFDVSFKNAISLARFRNEKSLQLLIRMLNNETYRQRAMDVLEKYFGGKVKKESDVKKISCPACDGTGKCSGCKGSGKKEAGALLVLFCEWCGGSGKCFVCKGEGYITKTYYKYIYIPPPEGNVNVGMPEIEKGEY